MIRLFTGHHWVAAVFALIATIGWTVQGVGNAYYYREVRASWYFLMHHCCNADNSWLDISTPFSRGTYDGKGCE